jgi:protein-S-isoprenylcysteine O-methyltransferase Ste14
MKITRNNKMFGIGPIGTAVSLSIFAVLWLVDSAFVHSKIAHRVVPLRISGLILIGIWIGWHVWAMSFIRLWWYRDQLCTKGPYAVVKHPMYAGGIFLLAPGIILLLNSWTLLLWPILSYPIWSALVRKEEKMMTEVFGENYKSYAARTGRLFPLPRFAQRYHR